MPLATAPEYKDRLFSFIFGHPGNEEWTLSLYNAVRGTDYTDPSTVQINTIQEALYLSMHNDVSFIIADEINLYEQQSTYNPNMPLRMLQYAALLFEKYVTTNKKNKYGTTLVELPVPKLVVFYNGTRDLKDEVALELADAFPTGSDPDIAVHVRMININRGHSASVLDECEPLKEYSWIVAQVRELTASGIEPGQAADSTLAHLPSDFVIKGFIDDHRAEVAQMLLTEYDEAKAMEMFKNEGREEGREEGIVNTLVSLVKDGYLPLNVAAKRANLSEDKFKEILDLSQAENN